MWAGWVGSNPIHLHSSDITDSDRVDPWIRIDLVHQYRSNLVDSNRVSHLETTVSHAKSSSWSDCYIIISATSLYLSHQQAMICHISKPWYVHNVNCHVIIARSITMLAPEPLDVALVPFRVCYVSVPGFLVPLHSPVPCSYVNACEPMLLYYVSPC